MYKAELEKVKKDIFESEAKLRAIMEAFDGLIYVSNPDYRIIYINERIIKRKGYDIKEEKCFKALHERDEPCPFCAMKQIQKGLAVKFEVKDPRDNRWYHSSNTPVYHADGTISLLAMITDIHERKIAEKILKKEEERLRRQVRVLKSDLGERYRFGDIIGKSSVMQKVYEQIVTTAATDASVIIYGEPGAGKELVARAIHKASARTMGPFVPVHCGAIPYQLFESEFFGYKKGAFSGAYKDNPGYLDYADGGTLFLDEIGEMTPHMQMKLLRAIEGGGYTPVGSNRSRKSDFRIIAATNRDIKEQVQKGLMRQDFFYRIHIIPIHLPPLRERKEDIPLLVDHFLAMHHNDKEPLPPISGKFYELFNNYDWPGNVRELQNAIIRYLAVKNFDFIKAPVKQSALSDDFIQKISGPMDGGLKHMVADLEKKVIKKTLEQNMWHKSKVAKILGIDRKTLANKIKLYGITGVSK